MMGARRPRGIDALMIFSSMRRVGCDVCGASVRWTRDILAMTNLLSRFFGRKNLFSITPWRRFLVLYPRAWLRQVV